MYKKIFTAMAFTLFTCNAMAQYHSDFEIMKSDNPSEIVYKGACTFEDVALVPAFNLAENAAKYQPDEETIATLNERLPNVELLIFLGTWCEDSHNLIPKLYKVLQQTAYPNDKLMVYALDRDKKGKSGEETAYKITNVPTIIVMQGGVEAGRITEMVKTSVEQDLLNIIQSVK